ncbi:hypothetical protein ACXYMU_16715 [Pontibacter sp. CAU 1760]
MKAFFLLLSLAFTLNVANAQRTAKEGSPARNSLTEQYNRLKSGANSYSEGGRDYKVINVKSMDAFWKSVQDTIKAREQAMVQAGKNTEQALVEAKDSIQKQHSQLQAIRKQYAAKEQEVQQSAYNVANLQVLGMDMEKQNYVILSFVVIVVLLLMAGIMLVQYRSSRQTAVDKQKAYDEIDNEYNEYKKNAREKELKLKRELQTEMNRIEEMNQEIASLKKHSHQ